MCSKLRMDPGRDLTAGLFQGWLLPVLLKSGALSDPVPFNVEWTKFFVNKYRMEKVICIYPYELIEILLCVRASTGSPFTQDMMSLL